MQEFDTTGFAHAVRDLALARGAAADHPALQGRLRRRVAALLEDGRARVDLTVTSRGDKVLSLARAIVALA